MIMYAVIGQFLMHYACGLNSFMWLLQCTDVATDGSSQASENWSQFMTICDAINSADEGYCLSLVGLEKMLFFECGIM